MSPDGMADAPGLQPGVSRRNFIKGVIAAGATVSASAYLFRTTILGQNDSMAGAVERLITLGINGQQRRVDVLKNETLAMTLREDGAIDARVRHPDGTLQSFTLVREADSIVAFDAQGHEIARVGDVLGEPVLLAAR